MCLRELLRIIMKRKMTYMTAVILIGASFLCAAASFSIDGLASEAYLINFNWKILHFLIQYPLMLMLSIPVYSIIQNDMLRVRQRDHDRIFQTEALAALILSLVYAFIKTAIEYVFFVAMGGTLNAIMIMVGFVLLLLTTHMVILLFLAFKVFMRGSVWSVLILTTLLGVDTMTAVVYIPLFPDSLMLLAIPLSTAISFLTDGAVNVLLLCGISLLKVMLALILFRFAVRRAEFA